MNRFLVKLVLIVMLLSFICILCGCSKVKESNEEKLKHKVSTEISYLEKELISIINEVNNQTDWEAQKNKIDKLYTSVPTISADLKELGVSNSEIEQLSNSIDNIAVSIINEQENETISNTILSYSILPNLINKSEGESKNNQIINLKYYTLLCYKDIKNNEWNSLNKDIENLKLNFSNIKNINNENYSQKEINIKKADILIEELKNCVNLQNQELATLKYQKLMQELNLMMVD